MDAFLLQPRGFCAGVTRAIEIVRRALAIHGAPVYVVHEIVHNEHVVADLCESGAIFVQDVDAVPEGAVTILSAHGVARSVVDRAAARRLEVIDATCPLVEKVHQEARRYEREERTVVIIGHRGHPEVEGTRGQIGGPVHVVATASEVERLPLPAQARVAYVTQTTLSQDDTREVIAALERRFSVLVGPGLDDICYATQNRQAAVRENAGELDVLLVVGARTSSNSNRLREVGEQSGLSSHLVQSAADLDPAWFFPGARVGVTAGASAPEFLVQALIRRLRALGARSVREIEGLRETTVFSLPDALAGERPAKGSTGID